MTVMHETSNEVPEPRAFGVGSLPCPRSLAGPRLEDPRTMPTVYTVGLDESAAIFLTRPVYQAALCAGAVTHFLSAHFYCGNAANISLNAKSGFPPRNVLNSSVH